MTHNTEQTQHRTNTTQNKHNTEQTGHRHARRSEGSVCGGGEDVQRGGKRRNSKRKGDFKRRKNNDFNIKKTNIVKYIDQTGKCIYF